MAPLALIIVVLLIHQCVSDQPNLLFIMADDLGWNDVNWHDYNMHTPNLNGLAHNNGVKLNQAYVNKLCSITRSAFLAGHYPFHMGTQSDTFFWMEPSGVPLEFRFFPQDLQQAGYSTYLVGKWHLGYCKKEFLPTSRGFDHFRGYYCGKEDFYNHSFTYKASKNTYVGLDFWDENKPRFDLNGSYSTEIYTDYAKDYLTNHNKSKPFFMYLAYQAVHNPLQVPNRYLAPCKQKHKQRRIYCGMVNAMDQSIGTVIKTLKELGYYNNTVIMFSTDNGGDTNWGGNNYPLRGNKDTLWEGGTRAISFVHSSTYIKKPGERNQMFSIVDWYATILSLAGIQKEQYGDGINQWKMISEDTDGGRKSFVYNIYPTGSAIRMGKYKMILGNAGTPSGWIPPSGRIATKKSDNNKGLLLFDLENDPMERVDLISAKKSHLISTMLAQIAKYLDEMKLSVHKGIDIRGDPKLFNDTYGCCWC